MIGETVDRNPQPQRIYGEDDYQLLGAMDYGEATYEGEYDMSSEWRRSSVPWLRVAAVLLTFLLVYGSFAAGTRYASAAACSSRCCLPDPPQ